MSALLYKKGHLKNQVPHCIIYLEDDRKRVPVALGIINRSKKLSQSNFGRWVLLISFYVDLCKSMTVKITNNKVRTSIVFIGHHPPFVKLEGRGRNFASGSVQLYLFSIT